MIDRDELGEFERFVVRDVDAALRAKSAYKPVPRVQARSRGRFVKGPIPADLLARAYRAHRAGPNVLLAVKAAVDMAMANGAPDFPEVSVTNGLLKVFGIRRDARIQALKALAVAGLLTVRWDGKRAIRARLVGAMWP